MFLLGSVAPVWKRQRVWKYGHSRVEKRELKKKFLRLLRSAPGCFSEGGQTIATDRSATAQWQNLFQKICLVKKTFPSNAAKKTPFPPADISFAPSARTEPSPQPQSHHDYSSSRGDESKCHLQS